MMNLKNNRFNLKNKWKVRKQYHLKVQKNLAIFKMRKVEEFKYKLMRIFKIFKLKIYH